MRFLLINQPMFNRGDESAHKALVYALLQHFPDCTVEVLFADRPQEAVDECRVNDTRVTYTNLAIDRRYYKTYIWNLKHWLRILWYFNPTVRKIVRHYRQADWIISSPGDRSLGSRYDWDHLFFVSLAEYAGCKVAYYGRSIGPFPEDSPLHVRFNFLARRALRKSRFVSLRDRESAAIAAELGIRYLPTLDTAFLYTPLVQMPSDIRERTGDKYIVLVPTFLKWSRKDSGSSCPVRMQVRLFYSEVCRRILEMFPDHKVVMLPQLFSTGDVSTGDYAFFKEIASDVADNRVEVLPDTLISEFHQTVIAGSKCVLGARYHSIVFAINNNVPFVALNYEDRILGMLESLGKQDRCVDITMALDDRSLAFESQVALARIMEKMKSLQPDEGARIMAKAKTSECFEKFAVTVKDSKRPRRK